MLNTKLKRLIQGLFFTLLVGGLINHNRSEPVAEKNKVDNKGVVNTAPSVSLENTPPQAQSVIERQPAQVVSKQEQHTIITHENPNDAAEDFSDASISNENEKSEIISEEVYLNSELDEQNSPQETASSEEAGDQAGQVVIKRKRKVEVDKSFKPAPDQIVGNLFEEGKISEEEAIKMRQDLNELIAQVDQNPEKYIQQIENNEELKESIEQFELNRHNDADTEKPE